MLVKLSKITHWYLTLTYKRFHMNPSLIEKRKWNSYPNKTIKTFKVYEIILNKRWGKLWQKTSLKLFTFRTLKILWFHRFRRKKHTCIIKPVLVFCIVLRCFLCCFYFIKQHFIKDNNEKKKPRPQKRNHSLLPSKDMPKISAETRTSNFNYSLRGSSLFWGSREKSRESSARKVTLVRGAEWEARSLAPSFAF